ncbi:MAG: hypothetical protein ACI9LY_001135 [Arenicella sp.]|jgi:hypothetical protein
MLPKRCALLIAVADAASGITEIELEVFAKFFARYAFVDKLDISRIKQTLDHRLAEVNDKTPEPQRMQVRYDR